MVSVHREWRGGRRKEGREDGGKGGWRRGRRIPLESPVL